MPIRPAPSLRGRLFLFLTAVFAVLFAGLLREQADGERLAREKALARSTDLARGHVHQYERLLRERLTMLDTLLRLPGFELGDSVRCEETLRHIVATDPSLVNVVLLDGQARVRCAGRSGSITDAAAATVRRALESRDAMVGMSGTDGQARAYLTLARPILDGSGAVRGTLLAYLDRDWLNARFAEAVPAGAVLRIFDGDGIFVVRQPNPECCVGKSGLQLDGIAEALAGGREQARKSLWLDGVERLQADLPLAAPLAGVLSIGIPEAQVLTDADRATARLGWLLAALCLALYGLSWLFSDRYILRPLRALTEGTRRLREGELAFRIPEAAGSDEFVLLRRNFNEMADTLGARQEEIRRDMEKLAVSEKALRENELRLRLAASVFEQANEAIAITDDKAAIIAVSRRFTAITGYRADEAIGRNPRLLQSGRHDAAFYRAMWDALLEQGHWSGEIWSRRKDGTIYPEWLSISAVRDENGRTANYVAVFSDLTERKAAEQAVRDSAALMRLILDTALDAVISMGHDGRVLEWNAQAERMFGYSRTAAIGAALAELIVPPQLREAHNAGLRRYLESGEGPALGRRIEITAMRADGSEFPVELAIATVAGENGLFFSAFIRDISERRAAENQLRESRERLTTLIEAIPDPIFFKDGENRWQIVNAAAKRLFRIGSLPWQGKTDIELALLQPEMSGEHMSCWSSDEAAWHTRGVTQSTEVLRGDDGRTLIYNMNKVPLFDDEGGRQALVIHGRDVTDQYRHAEDQRRLNDELEQRVMERTRALQTANRELESFSYSVSHDLRAPLRAINGFSHLLDEEYAGTLDDKARNYLSRVRAASERMGQLIDDLLHLSQMSRQPMQLAQANLSALAAEIAAELQAGEAGRQAEWIIAPDIVAEGDEGLLRAVLLNLLGNAWKYSARRADARIEFGVANNGGPPAYFVRDNGAGFDMAHAGRLFGAFQRLHSPAEFPGSGIGLATVARIVQRHGGEVWAEGSPGKGATFYFTLQAGARSDSRQ